MILYCCCFALLSSCEQLIRRSGEVAYALKTDSSKAYASLPDSVEIKDSSRRDNIMNVDTLTPELSGVIDTKNVHPHQLVQFAQTLIGIPYLYGSTDPAKGFDCSGFITHVFNHFGIKVPRSSIDFTNVGREIPVAAAKPGDIVLFTGTDSTEKFVGHMGIIVSNGDTAKFIHSTSGKAYGVTITPLNDYYKTRFVKTLRIFKQNDGNI